MTTEAKRWFGRKQINRFDLYRPMAPYRKPKLVGMINNDNDYDLGTPSLNRQENITIVTSSATHQDSLIVNFKWRPCEGSDLVVLSTKIQLSLVDRGSCYEHEEHVVYKPKRSQLRPNYFTQYGSPQSSLKLFINAPYRKMRLTFRGRAKNKNSSGDTKFIKAGFIVCSTSGLFDFMEELPHKATKQSDASDEEDTEESSRVRERFKLTNDRHEQLVQVKGEYVVEEKHGAEKVRGEFSGWGFHGRQFVHEISRPIQSKRILLHTDRGRAFHFGQFTLNRHHDEFAVACLDRNVALEPFNNSYSINWSEVQNLNDKFEISIETRNGNFKTTATRKPLGDLYEFELGEERGWALVCENDGFDSDEEAYKWQVSFIEHQTALRAGKLAQDMKFDSLEKPYVVSINEPTCTSADLVGSKASSLAQLDSFSKISALKYQVPHAFVLTRFVYETIMNTNESIRRAINDLENKLGEGEIVGLQSECEQMEKLIARTNMPEDVLQELKVKLESRYGKATLEESKFAVRSSSWGEDEEDMSAAGQLTTFLNVRGVDAVAKAVMSCFASKFSYANVEYKRQHGLGQNLPMAVVIQEMIDCEKAGVLFTCDPTTGNEAIQTITANYGLGESVVSGQAEPDMILARVEKLSSEVSVESIKIGQKQVVIDGRSTQADGITDKGQESDQLGAEGLEYDRTKCCLNEEEILDLARCGLALADHYQGPRDIEWGFAGNSLYLFQSRPVTGLDNYSEFELLHEGDLASRRELDFLTRANIGEVKPFPVTPLSLSYADRFMCMLSFQGITMTLGSRYVTEANQAMIVDSYHAFLSLLDSFFSRARSEKGKTLESKTMDYAIFGHEMEEPEIEKMLDYLAPSEAGFHESSFFMVFTIPFRLSPLKTIANHRKRVERARTHVANRKFAKGYEENKMMGLLRQVEWVVDYGSTAIKNHGCAIIFGNIYNSLLVKKLSKYISDPVKIFATLAKILALSPGVISVEVPQRVEAIAQMIVSAISSPEVEEFIKMSPIEALNFIQTSNQAISGEFNSFIDLFGHRCYNEFEISQKPWGEKPEELAEMIQRYCATLVQPRKGQEGDDNAANGQTSIDTDAIAFKNHHNGLRRLKADESAAKAFEIIESLQVNMSLKDKLLLKHKHIPRCQLYVGAREQTKDVFISHNDLMRRATRMLAKELRRNLRIPDEDLIYYMFYNELEPLVREPQPSLVVQAARRRNLFKTSFRGVWKYDEVIRGYDITPHHKKPSLEINEALANSPRLYGTPASSGKIQGRVCLVLSYDQLSKVSSGDILVAHSTDIGYSPVFPLLSGIVTEVGGLISHGAVVAREYGLPSVLGVPGVTRVLKDGDEVVLDADNGVIIRL